MIVSYSHGFIFCHARKVAGSAIKVYLARSLRREDILVGSWDECLEHGVMPNRRFYIDLTTPTALARLPKILGKGIFGGRRAGAVVRAELNNAHKDGYRPVLGSNPPHPSAAELRSFVGGFWDQAFKFAFVRNPFDRVVSEYLWLCRCARVHISFREFLEALERGHGAYPIGGRRDNWPVYSAGNAVDLDFVGRYEHLALDLAKICEVVGVPYDRGAVPPVKSAGDRGSYRRWYGEYERGIVERVFRREIEQFEYFF